MIASDRGGSSDGSTWHIYCSQYIAIQLAPNFRQYITQHNFGVDNILQCVIYCFLYLPTFKNNITAKRPVWEHSHTHCV
jgi:hypothetical protein